MKEQFCEGCPYVPKGAVAEVALVEVPNEAMKRRATDTTMNLYNPNLIDLALQITTVTVRIIEASPASGVEVDDEGTLRIWNPDKNERQIRTAIANCPHPKKGLLAKLLGSQGTCQAVKQM